MLRSRLSCLGSGFAGFALAALAACAGGPVPTEDFARTAGMAEMKLSPDGKYVGFVRGVGEDRRLVFADVESLRERTVQLNGIVGVRSDRDVANFDWIGPTRVLVRMVAGDYESGWVSVERSGGDAQALSGEFVSSPRSGPRDFRPRKVLHYFGDNRTVLVSNHRTDADPGGALHPDVVKLDARSGTGSTVVRNPGNVIRWVADGKGDVRVGLAREGSRFSLLYRGDGRGEWRTLATFAGDGEGALGPVGFAGDGRTLLVRARSPQGRWALYGYDPEGNRRLGAVWEHAEYDFGGTVREPGTRRVVGVHYEGERPAVQWLDERYAAMQARLDAARPGCVNVPVNFSADGRRVLVNSFSDRDPGAVFLYEAELGRLRELGRVRGWIDPEKMAEQRPVSFPARDGLRIHGYLTRPAGGTGRGLPLVVMPHGGPWARDVWGFDPLVQLLANRGYAVLQVNYRGSTGYGMEFEQRGRLEIGGRIQDDIDDGARWAAEAGVADPGRMAILGVSYGGYSALFALGRRPEPYRCGVAISAVTDWLMSFETINTPEGELSRVHWSREIGDPLAEAGRLREISPVNFAERIGAPVLLIHGKEDRVVPFRQARAMAAALKKAGRTAETVFLEGEGHTIHGAAARLRQYRAIEAFLAKHLGGAVDRAGPARAAKR